MMQEDEFAIIAECPYHGEQAITGIYVAGIALACGCMFDKTLGGWTVRKQGENIAEEAMRNIDEWQVLHNSKEAFQFLADGKKEPGDES